MATVPSKSLSRIAKKVFGDVKEVPQIVQEGRRALHKGEGAHSFVLWPFVAALKKLKGKDKINNVIYEKYLKRIRNADERLGKVLAQHGPSEKLFSTKELVPTRKRIKGLPAHVEHESWAASAPVSKAMKVVTPLAAGMYLSEKLGSQQPGATMAQDEAKTLMKKAADAIERHQRREEAIKLAFEMVQRGKCNPFETYDEFQEKVASLEEKNIDVVREALEMDSDMADFGKVASEQTAPAGSGKAEMNFFHRLSE